MWLLFAKEQLGSRQGILESVVALVIDLWVRLNNWWVKMIGLLARYEAGSQVSLRVRNFKSLRQVASYAI